MRKPIVAGNWKMHGSKALTKELILGIAEGLTNIKPEGLDVAVCPPYPYLAEAGCILASQNCPNLHLGSQDVSNEPEGAFTGQVSASMLKEFGAKYAIVGHSERRAYNQETNDLVADKFFAAKDAGITPILCVGEQLDEREQNKTESVVGAQLMAVLDKKGPEAMLGSVIAYEPVWAIGTGVTASPQQAQDVHAFLRQTIAKMDEKLAKSVQILYGGSVKANNAKELFAMPDIDGGLIGGASLKADDFLAICQSAYIEP